jgi:hypothetical protein
MARATTASSVRGERSAVTRGENGSTKISLDEGESVGVATDDTGAVTIEITQPPAENGNDVGVGPRSAAAPTRPAHRAPRSREMSIAAQRGGSLPISPDRGAELITLGNPAEGEIEIVEVVPAEPVA